jgi:transposase-like protein
LQTIEVVTGKERRRRWSDEEKLRLVAESCLYTWRKRFAELATAAERPVPIPAASAPPRSTP